MVKNVKEIPITYLNKGQTYELFIRDLNPPKVSSEPIRYRTYVRVSFEEEEQRAKPSTCWQLWKEGRGTNEAHQRGGKLLAVEYAGPSQDGGEMHKDRQIQIERLSFDGFCVTWTSNPDAGTNDCTIPVRFNFLSTDFSRSKGVKGSTVRLCAKVELLPRWEEPSVTRDVELSYCMVKLFRDHGAERKLSNDIAHVKKNMDKLKQQNSQAKTGGGCGKRKRDNNSSATTKPIDYPMKQSKHNRTWFMNSDNEAPEKAFLDDYIHTKMAKMQDMFSSTRPTSIFGLRGDPADDPDLYPVRLYAGESAQFENRSRQNGDHLQSAELMISPATTHSFDSPPPISTKLPEYPTTTQGVPPGDQLSTDFSKAVDTVLAYRSPFERPPRPVACFYVRFGAVEKSSHDYYRAVYLSERTARDLMKQISLQQIDPAHIVRMTRVKENGMRVMMDDDVVRELPEGQDMIVDISEALGADGNTAVEIELTY